MVRNLLLCFLPDADRADPTLCWQACVQWGPVVYATTRRGAIRKAVEIWLKERQAEIVTSFAVKMARREMTVVQVARPIAIRWYNSLDGGRG